MGLGPLFFGLAGGPLAWSAQLIVNFALASYTCYPRYVPRIGVRPAWHGVWSALLIINLVAIAVSLAAAAVSYRNWRVTLAERAGASGHVLEAGEGRTCFIAIAGIMTALGFAAAIVFDLIVLLVVPQCLG